MCRAVNGQEKIEYDWPAALRTHLRVDTWNQHIGRVVAIGNFKV